MDCRIRSEVLNWPEAAREAFEERAAIIEYEGGSQRFFAEAAAYEQTKAAMLRGEYSDG